LPPKSRAAIKNVELYREKGRVGTFDHGKFQVGGDFSPSTGTIRIFDANYLTRNYYDKMVGHEAGHAAYHKIKTASMVEFGRITNLERPISSYARNWFKTSTVTGINENFAECHAAFMSRIPQELKLLQKHYPQTFDTFKKIWLEELGGEKWW